MPFREKSAWICLVSMFAVFVPYFIHVFRLTAKPDFNAGAIQHAIVAAIFFQTVFAIVAHIVVAVGSKRHSDKYFVIAEVAHYLGQIVRYRLGA